MEKVMQKRIDTLIKRRDAFLEKITTSSPTPQLKNEFRTLRKDIQNHLKKIARKGA